MFSITVIFSLFSGYLQRESSQRRTVKLPGKYGSGPGQQTRGWGYPDPEPGDRIVPVTPAPRSHYMAQLPHPDIPSRGGFQKKPSAGEMTKNSLLMDKLNFSCTSFGNSAGPVSARLASFAPPFQIYVACPSTEITGPFPFGGKGVLDGKRHDQLPAHAEAGDVPCQQGE